MESREESLQSFDREDSIISNQVVNSPEETERLIKIMQRYIAIRKALQVLACTKANQPLAVKMQWSRNPASQLERFTINNII